VTEKDINLKFGVHIEYNKYYTKDAKLGDKEAWPRSRDRHLNFWTPSISPERRELLTSRSSQWGWRESQDRASIVILFFISSCIHCQMLCSSWILVTV